MSVAEAAVGMGSAATEKEREVQHMYVVRDRLRARWLLSLRSPEVRIRGGEQQRVSDPQLAVH